VAITGRRTELRGLRIDHDSQWFVLQVLELRGHERMFVILRETTANQHSEGEGGKGLKEEW